MIDALFGSKTRVKLLHLFLNNPGQSFYVREITRIIDEQINSVRRELSNMMEVGIVTCDNQDNKLYYQVNQRNDYYVPLKAIFGDKPTERMVSTNVATSIDEYRQMFLDITGLRLALIAGVLVKGSASAVDLLIIGDVSAAKAKSIVKSIEKKESREINYSVLSYDEFCYRLSIHDKFISEILNSKHNVLIDKDKMLEK